MNVTLIFAATFVAAYFGVAAVGAFGKKRHFLDIPNERSSHVKPTPHGGGIVIVVISLVFYVAVTMRLTGTFSWGYFAGALLVSGISLVDDLFTISVKWRFPAHAAAAALVIIDRGYWHEIGLPGGMAIPLGVAGIAVTFTWIVWLINAYNFMDGIDGIAGVQAITAAAGWMAIGWFTNSQIAFWLAAGILASTLGFLIHNWQPARLFMGDVGSAFLGFTFAVLPLLATTGELTDRLLPTASLLLVWLFVFDTVVTFLRRVFRRDIVWLAHREHIYQRLVQSGWSHAAVSVLYGVLGLAISAITVYVFTSISIHTSLSPITTLAATFVLLVIYWISIRAKRAKDAK